MEMFGANAQWLWENFDHYAIEQICKEKLNIDEFLEDESEDENGSSPKSTFVKQKLDKLNQEFLIFHERWTSLKDLHNLEKEDYTEEELETIRNRQKRREDKWEYDEDEIKKQKMEYKQKLAETQENIKNGNEYITESELDDLIIMSKDSIFEFEFETIDEDKELLRDTKK